MGSCRRALFEGSSLSLLAVAVVPKERLAVFKFLSFHTNDIFPGRVYPEAVTLVDIGDTNGLENEVSEEDTKRLAVVLLIVGTAIEGVLNLFRVSLPTTEKAIVGFIIFLWG